MMLMMTCLIRSPFNRKRGIRNGQGKGRSDPPEPSQSCTSPPPHTSFSPGTLVLFFLTEPDFSLDC